MQCEIWDSFVHRDVFSTWDSVWRKGGIQYVLNELNEPFVLRGGPLNTYATIYLMYPFKKRLKTQSERNMGILET